MEQPGGSEKLKKVIDEIGNKPGTSVGVEYKAGRDIGGKSTDERLGDDFEEVFKDISEDGGYKKWRKDAGSRPIDDGMDGELENLERETTVQDVRESMIEDLKSGMDISDVIEKYSK
jgi:hypothetical protein